MRKHALVLAAAIVASGIAVGGMAIAAEESPCRGNENETRVGYSASNPVQNELPTVYTDDAQNYAGVCGGTKGEAGNSYVEVQAMGGWTNGGAIVEGQTGNDQLDTLLNGPTGEYGPSTIGLVSSGDSSYGCAPEGSTQYGYWQGNAVQRDLPTVYADGGVNYLGACGGTGGYIQFNSLVGAVNGDNALVEGKTGVEAVDAQVWGDGTESYGPAEVWLTGGGPEGTVPPCAPEGDTTVGHENGNTITRELPTVYTDGGASHVGICGDGKYLQVNSLGSPLYGEKLIEGESGTPELDDTIVPLLP